MKIKIAATTVACTLALSACAGGAGGDSGPIVVGSVNTLSGPATFPEASQAAQAVFDAYNESGGFNGREIEYNLLDDRGDPAGATGAARELVGNEDTVALVGSASLLECELNSEYYEQEGILSMPGIGVDAGCFQSENISPANVGPYNDFTLTLLYGSEVLELDNICVLLQIAGSTLPSYQAAVDRWTEITGEEPHYIDETLPVAAADYTSYLVSAREAGCEALAVNPIEPDAIAQVNAANAQGWDDVTWLYLTSVYSENFASAVSEAGAGIYVPAEFYPFTDESEVTDEWRTLMESNDIPLTSFSQGGYLAATYFIEVLESVEGDVTRESVGEALRNAPPIENPMVGAPYEFGGENNAGWPIVLESGTNEWQTDADEWFFIE